MKSLLRSSLGLSKLTKYPPWNMTAMNNGYHYNYLNYRSHQSASDSEGIISFWEGAARDIDWVKHPKVVLDDSKSPFNKW